MTTEPAPYAGEREAHSRGFAEKQNKTLREAVSDWMRQEVSLRISRGWLGGIALAFLLLALLAFD